MKRSALTLGDLLTYAALALALVVFLSPVLWMLITAVKPPQEWLTTPPILVPSELHWLGQLHRRARHLGRSEGIGGQPDRGVAFDPALAHPRGSRRLCPRALQHRRRDLSFTVLSILFMPPVAVAIPMYLLWSALGLLDSYTALILQYTVFNLPFIAWVLKSFFEDIPPGMEESALVNGATRWRAFWQIAVPLARPAVLAVALLAFIFSWNEFFFALILTRANVTTLPFILPVLMEGHNVLWGDIAALATLGALPVVLLAFALQRYLVRGLSFGTVR